MHPVHDPIWSAILAETRQEAQREPALASFLHATILNHATFEAALSFHLASKLGSAALSSLLVRELIEQALRQDASIGNAARADIQAGLRAGLRLQQPTASRFCTLKDFTPCRPIGWPTGCGNRAASPSPIISKAIFL